MQSFLGDNDPDPGERGSAGDPPSHEPEILHIYDAHEDDPPREPYVLSRAEPETMAETIRKSGLAYSAAIALFASVVFMLLVGWGADLLFGSSPWGIIVGIALGALIGFIQFFRITSQIFRK
jgi:hypothetical protein